MRELLFEVIKKVKSENPLVHNITNFVVMNFTANALLAIGASPVMAHAKEEVEEMVSISKALVINIGTLSENWVEAMKIAIKRANELSIPVVLDPVGSGATNYRTNVVKEFLSLYKINVIRGNASEIMSIFNSTFSTKGVDSTIDSSEVVISASEISNKYSCVICISGKDDYVIKDKKVIKLSNGNIMMTKITGMGCVATAIIGACIAVEKDFLLATASATALMGVAGEIAYESSNGPASMKVKFIDELYNMSETEFYRRLKYTDYEL